MVDFVQIDGGSSKLTPSKVKLTNIPSKDEPANPIFNFSQKFIDELQSIGPLDKGTAVSFIALRAVNEQGKILHDFNLELFQKPIDLSKLNTKERFSDRPAASLIDLKIKTDQGSGHIYTHDISFTIKVHKPDIAFNGTLIALLFPGMPMEVEYGWKNAASKNSLMNTTEKLLFSLRTYNFNYTQDGQVDLVIEGTAFISRFNNTLLGDEKGEEASSDAEARKDGLSNQYSLNKKYQEYIQKLKDNPEKGGVRDTALLEKMFQSYQTILETSSGEVRNNFRKNMRKLKDHQQSGAEYQEGNNIKLPVFSEKFGMITLHDLISTMCEGTLKAFQGVTRVNKLRFVYGLFHNEVGNNQGKNQSKFAGQPISDFPIDLSVFRKKMSKYRESKGTEVMTLQAFLNTLIDEFFHNDGYWKKLEGTKDGVRTPKMVLAFNNYRVGDSIQMDVSLIDVGQGIPMTSGIIKDVKTSSVGDFEKKLRELGMPVIKLGHSNSFIQNLKMNNVMDEEMKSALIRRMADASSTVTRAWIPPGLQKALVGSDTKTPLQLPLQGILTVVGSTHWKPFRSFGLLAGIFIIDGVYQILSVTHTLNGAGFTTTLEILYH